jgi:NAD-dependent deacetylase
MPLASGVALPTEVQARCAAALAADGPIVWLTGAGVSAESGVPTFRGPEGYWRVGSRNYHPQELATHAAFAEMPDEVWSWYLYRRSVCRAASPNGAHRALAALEEALADRFLLLTQNVDGLHLRAGNTPARTYQIHGNIDFMRFDHGDRAPRPIPCAIDLQWPKERRLTVRERDALSDAGGRLARPHVLWFDEHYDEELFRWDSSIVAAERASMLVVVGTTGSTNLPLRVGAIAARRGVPLLVINPEPSPFTDLAAATPGGFVLEGSAGAFVPALVEALMAIARGSRSAP